MTGLALAELFAQEALVSAEGDGAGSGGSISYSIGQVFSASPKGSAWLITLALLLVPGTVPV